MYDYPIWLFEVDRLAALLRGDPSVAAVYHSVCAPVPNAGLVGTIYLLSRVLDIETAGKIVLALCVAGLPWVWFWSVSRIKGSGSGLAYLGFPFAFNLFFWGRDGYLLALIGFIGATGWLVTALRAPDRRITATLAVLGPVVYFLHGAIFAVWVLVVIALAMRNERPAVQRMRWMIAGAVPGIALFIWYGLTAAQGSPDAGLTWGITALARNVVKPLLLFMKMYGIESPVPLTLANAAWVAIMVAAIGSAMRRSDWRRFVREPLLPVLAVCGLGAFALPDTAFGIVSPGAYCVLPALFLLVVLLPEGGKSGWKPAAFIVCAFAMTIYTAVHVSRADAMMTQCVNDTRTYARLDGPHAVVRYDWPASTGPGDALSASVNPLFGAHYYALLDAPGPAWIHGTALLRLRQDHAWLQPQFSGATRNEFHASVVSGLGALDRFATVMVTGKNEEAAEIIERLGERGFSPVCTRPNWTILHRGHPGVRRDP
jgi:hypothetical protein